MVPYPLHDLLVEQVNIIITVIADMMVSRIGDDFDELCMMITCMYDKSF